MKYTSLFFDWGDTLAPLNEKKVPIASDWIREMIPRLYSRCYRLAIISNSYRYQDAQWIRKELENRGLLSFFEVVISTGTYSIHKPSPEIFQKAYDFMQIDPKQVVMIGDSEHCDGGCQDLGSSYFKVKSNVRWDKDLYKFIEEDFSPQRILTNLYDFSLVDDVVTTPLVHLSKPLKMSDHLLLNDKEYIVTETNRYVSLSEILSAPKDESYEFKVKLV